MSPSDAKKQRGKYHLLKNLCDTKITFTNNDLLFHGTLYNCPLYIEGHVVENKMNKILIDERFGINIMPIHPSKEVSIQTEKLSESCLLNKDSIKGDKKVHMFY